MTPTFTLDRFTPSESGWIFATLSDDREWTIYGLLGWAEITVKAIPESFRTVVPVAVGPQGEGDVSVMYEPEERYRVHHSPDLFRLAQQSSYMLTTSELELALEVGVPNE